jgi:hypothetical protein
MCLTPSSGDLAALGRAEPASVAARIAAAATATTANPAVDRFIGIPLVADRAILIDFG